MSFIPILRLFCLAVWLFLPASLEAQEGPMWVAVGAQGRRLSSTDGVHFDKESTWRDGLLRAVAFGAGRFLAVGQTGGRGCACSTVDGEHWTEWPEEREMTALAFGRGKFVGIAGGELLISDGTGPFTPGARLPWAGEIHPLQIACGDTEAGFRFVVIGEADLADKGEHVPWRGVTGDGTRWEHAASGTTPARGLAYGAGIFVIVGPGGLIETSHDGEAWDRADAHPAEDFCSVVWDGHRFLAGGKHLWTSSDGFTWKLTGPMPPGTLLWAGSDAMLGVSWEGKLACSKEGNAWPLCEMRAGPRLTAVAFRPAQASE